MNWTWADIVAVVGAAAWIPQIWKFFLRAKVTPIIGGQIEIGFANLGPVFNPRLALRTERKSALVTGIDYQVTHERGQTAFFRCVQLVETGAFSESTSGEKALHQRQRDVVAIALVPDGIAERKTNSREIGCLENLESLQIALGRAMDRFRREGTDWYDDLQRSPEFEAIKTQLSDSFAWQAGEYAVECTITVAGNAAASTCKFRFFLGEGSAALLRANLITIETNLKQSVLVKPAPKPLDYNWVYPYALKE